MECTKGGQSQMESSVFRGWRREPNPRVPGRKGASLFYMIPLERWNVERMFAFSAKTEDVSAFSSTLLAHLERRMKNAFQPFQRDVEGKR